MGDHRQALEYDLMTRTRFTLADVGGALSNGALLAFCRHLPGESATMREIDPDAEWTLVPQLLAGISDGLQQMIWLYSCAHSRKGARPRQPEPIPRPGVKSRQKRIGKSAIPISQFDDWYYGGDDDG